jgi:hypothetical protein
MVKLYYPFTQNGQIGSNQKKKKWLTKYFRDSLVTLTTFVVLSSFILAAFVWLFSTQLAL